MIFNCTTIVPVYMHGLCSDRQYLVWIGLKANLLTLHVAVVAMMWCGVLFWCMQHGEGIADIRTSATASRQENIRTLYGASIARYDSVSIIFMQTLDDGTMHITVVGGGRDELCCNSIAQTAGATFILVTQKISSCFARGCLDGSSWLV